MCKWWHQNNRRGSKGIKLIYVASPYAGDVEKNIEYAKEACRFVMSKGHAFFAPHLLHHSVLDDNQPTERQLGIEMGLTMLERCDELWVFGEQISNGMAAEIEQAKRISSPIQYFSLTQKPCEICAKQKPVYAIWAKGRPDGPFAGEMGYLCERQEFINFLSQKEVELRISDIRNLCMNNTPAADYECVVLPMHPSPERMHLETLKELDLVPSFTPKNFEVKCRIYDNTGGNSMVGTVQFYLPELNKSVWVNCNDEGVSITSADYTWNEDASESWERYENVALFNLDFNESLPEDAPLWLPMIMETLAYTIERDANYFGKTCLPVAWLPDILNEGIESDYLDWLRARDERVCIAAGNKIIIDEAYHYDGPRRPEVGAMAPV